MRAKGVWRGGQYCVKTASGRLRRYREGEGKSDQKECNKLVAPASGAYARALGASGAGQSLSEAATGESNGREGIVGGSRGGKGRHVSKHRTAAPRGKALSPHSTRASALRGAGGEQRGSLGRARQRGRGELRDFIASFGL